MSATSQVQEANLFPWRVRVDSIMLHNIVITWIYIYIWFICDLQNLKFSPINSPNRISISFTTDAGTLPRDRLQSLTTTTDAALRPAVVYDNVQCCVCFTIFIPTRTVQDDESIQLLRWRRRSSARHHHWTATAKVYNNTIYYSETSSLERPYDNIIVVVVVVIVCRWRVQWDVVRAPPLSRPSRSTTRPPTLPLRASFTDVENIHNNNNNNKKVIITQ